MRPCVLEGLRMMQKDESEIETFWPDHWKSGCICWNKDMCLCHRASVRMCMYTGMGEGSGWDERCGSRSPHIPCLLSSGSPLLSREGEGSGVRDGIGGLRSDKGMHDRESKFIHFRYSDEAK